MEVDASSGIAGHDTVDAVDLASYINRSKALPGPLDRHADAWLQVVLTACLLARCNFVASGALTRGLLSLFLLPLTLVCGLSLGYLLRVLLLPKLVCLELARLLDCSSTVVFGFNPAVLFQKRSLLCGPALLFCLRLLKENTLIWRHANARLVRAIG